MEPDRGKDRASDAWRRLLAANGVGLEMARRLVNAVGSPERVLAVTRSSLKEVAGLTWSQVDRIHSSISKVNVEKEIRWLKRRNGGLVAFGESRYPMSLAPLPDPPSMLRYLGDPSVLSTPCIAIVGTRRCTARGLRQAGRFVQGIVEAGCTIVSGGARGIDAEAHRAAMRFGGRTIAVLGSGLGCPYPVEHEALFDFITGSGGTLLSEVHVHQEPRPGLFPRRNRIISGLSMAVVVVEAPVRSGAMITARLAVEEHGTDAMVVPGPADAWTSSGCHRAVQQGWAHLVTSPADVLDLLRDDYSSQEKIRRFSGLRAGQ